MASGTARARCAARCGRSRPSTVGSRGCGARRISAAGAPTVEAPVPVIVVGNVSVGGTGKTPFVIWLADQLKQRGRKVGIVTRGYRGKGTEWPRAVAADSDPEEVGDEPVLARSPHALPRRRGPGPSRVRRSAARAYARRRRAIGRRAAALPAGARVRDRGRRRRTRHGQRLVLAGRAAARASVAACRKSMRSSSTAAAGVTQACSVRTPSSRRSAA